MPSKSPLVLPPRRSAATSVPVVSNGNVFAPRDVLDSMEVTSCDGVMSAEGLLHDPGLFERAWVLRDRASTAPGPSGGAGGEGTESEGTRAPRRIRSTSTGQLLVE